MTPVLEQLILSGQADVRMHNHGVSGVGTIPVLKGTNSVVTQIIWNPFVDKSFVNNAPYSGAFFHTLKMRSKGKRYSITLRDTFNQVFDSKNNVFVRVPAAPVVIPVYFLFTEMVQFDIQKFQNYKDWEIESDYCPAVSNEPNEGEGYGTINTIGPIMKQQAVMGVDFQFSVGTHWAPRSFNPLNVRNPALDPAKFPDQTPEFEGTVPILLPPDNSGGGGPPRDEEFYQFPVLTFTIVDINKQYMPGGPLQPKRGPYEELK